MIRVLLAEDVHMVRGALVALLDLEPDITVVRDVATGPEAVAAILELRPDVALLDVDLPGLDGLEVAVQIRKAVPECRTLVLTSLSRPGTVRRALAAKVDGYLLKDTPSDRLADAVRAVASGRRVIESDLAVAAWDARENPLTAREAEILGLVRDGLDVDDIAHTVHLSVGTVRNYLTSAVTKLGARTRVDAVRLATEAEWL